MGIFSTFKNTVTAYEKNGILPSINRVYKINVMVTAKSLSKRFKCSERHIQKTAKSLGISKTKGRYLFAKDDISLIKSSLQGTANRTEPKRTTNIEDLKKAIHSLKNEVKILEDLIQKLN